MSSKKRDTNLATAGLAAATVLVFGATAAFAATSGGSTAKSRTAYQFAHGGTAYGAAPGAGESGSLPGGAVFGQGPHGDETVKDASGQWVEEIWQTGEVDSVDDDQVKVTDVTGLSWLWTVGSTAKVLIDGAVGEADEIRAGDAVTLSGTETDEVHTATSVSDPGNPQGK